MVGSANQVRPRIAIFEAHWLVQSSICYLAVSLEKAGYDVDIFLYQAYEGFCSDLLNETDSIKIHRVGAVIQNPDTTTPGHKNQYSSKLRALFKSVIPITLRRALRSIFQFCYHVFFPGAGLIPESVFQDVVQKATKDPYVLLIGVEKGGLYWAGKVAEQTKIPVAYYNLELYARNDPFLKKDVTLRRLKILEQCYHRKCVLTIVQDVKRGEFLLADNRVPQPMRMAYLPVSIDGGINTSESKWLQKELDLSSETVLVLYFGFIGKDRLSDKLVQSAQQFPENWRLVLHGCGNPEILGQITQADKLGRVRTSLRLVPAQEREEVIRSAQIGMAFYVNDTVNATLTGFASEKIALYFKCGVPLIANRYPSYEHIEEEHAGVLIDSIEELPAAIKKILADHDAYVRGAYECYKRHYWFETNFPAVLAGIRAVQKN